MPKPYTDESLMIVAIEKLRSEIAALPMAIAMNHARFGGGYAGGGSDAPRNKALENEIGGSVSAFDRPQAVIVVGPKPLPVSIVGGMPAAPRPRKEKEDEDEGGYISRLIGSLVKSLETMLGPVAVAGAIFTSAASGVSLLSSALNVFASSVAPILLPITFSLATAFVAASDAVWSKLKPALDEFDRFMLKVAVPAIRGLVDVVGTLTQAFIWLAKTIGPTAGGALIGGLIGYRYGGPVGALVGATYGAAAGAPKSLANERPSDYYTRQRGAGKSVVDSGLNTAGESVSRFWTAMFGGPSEAAQKATRDAQRDSIAEMRAMMGSHGGVGSIEGNWAAAQSAASNMTPFQVKVLQRLDETVVALQRAAGGSGEPEYASHPSGD